MTLLTISPPTRAATLAAALGAILPVLLLAGCGNDDPNAFPPVCAKVAILHDAADLTVDTPRGHDLTDLIVDGRITRLGGHCKSGRDNATLDTDVTVSMELTRGPALKTASTTVPWFVAVARGEQILDKHVFTLPVTFPPNTDGVSVTTDPVLLHLPTTHGLSGPSYHIIVGFQVTPDELALNRQRGER